MPTERPQEPLGYTHAALLSAGGSPRYLLAHEVAMIPRRNRVPRLILYALECFIAFGLLALGLILLGVSQ